MALQIIRNDYNEIEIGCLFWYSSKDQKGSSIMIIVYSINGAPIRLTTERWEHIILRHPEMVGEKDKVVETLTYPDLIQKGDYVTLIAIKFYNETPLTSKYLVVVYKEINKIDGFVLTAYFTSKPSERREILWKH